MGPLRLPLLRVSQPQARAIPAHLHLLLYAQIAQQALHLSRAHVPGHRHAINRGPQLLHAGYAALIGRIITLFSILIARPPGRGSRVQIPSRRISLPCDLFRRPVNLGLIPAQHRAFQNSTARVRPVKIGGNRKNERRVF